MENNLFPPGCYCSAPSCCSCSPGVPGSGLCGANRPIPSPRNVCHRSLPSCLGFSKQSDAAAPGAPRTAARVSPCETLCTVLTPPKSCPRADIPRKRLPGKRQRAVDMKVGNLSPRRLQALPQLCPSSSASRAQGTRMYVHGSELRISSRAPGSMINAADWQSMG